MSEEKHYYRPQELAEETGFALATVRRWIRDNRIEHVHFPKGVRIPREEFIRVIKNGPRPRPCNAL